MLECNALMDALVDALKKADLLGAARVCARVDNGLLDVLGLVHVGGAGEAEDGEGEGGGDEAHFEDGGGRDGRVEC